MSALELSQQATALRAKADRIDREREIRWHALKRQVATVTAQNRRDDATARRLRDEATQIEHDAADIRREERIADARHAVRARKQEVGR